MDAISTRCIGALAIICGSALLMGCSTTKPVQLPTPEPLVGAPAILGLPAEEQKQVASRLLDTHVRRVSNALSTQASNWDAVRVTGSGISGRQRYYVFSSKEPIFSVQMSGSVHGGMHGQRDRRDGRGRRGGGGDGFAVVTCDVYRVATAPGVEYGWTDLGVCGWMQRTTWTDRAGGQPVYVVHTTSLGAEAGRHPAPVSNPGFFAEFRNRAAAEAFMTDLAMALFCWDIVNDMKPPRIPMAEPAEALATATTAQ